MSEPRSEIGPLLLDEDEAEFVAANVERVRQLWLDTFHGAINGGAHDRADGYLANIQNCDRVLAKVRAQAAHPGRGHFPCPYRGATTGPLTVVDEDGTEWCRTCPTIIEPAAQFGREAQP